MGRTTGRALLAVALAVGALTLVPTAPAAAVTIPVTTTADGGPGSLRAAFETAAGNGVNDTIQLQAGATYTICAVLAHTDPGRSLVVDGNGATILRHCPGPGTNGLGTIRNNGAGTSLTLRDLTLTMSATSVSGSGAIQTGSTATTELFLDNVTITANRGAGQGGGIFSSGGYVDVDGSTISGNQASNAGGGIMMQAPFPTSGEALSVTDSSITGNRSEASGGGIAVLGDAPVTIFGSDISGNVATSPTTANGGGIQAYGDVSLFFSTISGNRSGAPWSALNAGGDVTLFSSTVSGNRRTAGAGDPGSAGLRTDGDLNASLSTIVGNAGVNLTFGDGDFSAFGNVIGQSGVNCTSSGTGTITSAGYNVEDDDQCGLGAGTGDRTSVADLGVLPLGDNGARGRTHHPTWAGGLIDSIPAANATCASVLFGFDQRQVNRPVDDGCEPGAIEVDVHHPALLPDHGFSDVPGWVEDAVRWAVYLGYVEGFPDNTYRPDVDISRAQVVRMLYRVAGSPEVAGFPPHGLSDVPGWIADAVRWAVGTEPLPIMSGFDDDTFRPNQSITRGQVVRSLYRMAGSPDVSGYPPHGLSDVPAWVEDAVRWAVRDPAGAALPVMTGYPDLTFRPDLAVTRGQVTRAVYRANAG